MTADNEEKPAGREDGGIIVEIFDFVKKTKSHSSETTEEVLVNIVCTNPSGGLSKNVHIFLGYVKFRLPSKLNRPKAVKMRCSKQRMIMLMLSLAVGGAFENRYLVIKSVLGVSNADSE